MGVPRVPDAIKLAQGTYRKSRDGDPAESVRVDGLPTPGPLAGDELDIWNDLVPPLIEMGIVGAIDSLCLRGMCEWYAEYRRLKKAMAAMLEQNPLMIDSEEYRRLSIGAKDAFMRFDSMGKKFAINASDRSGVRVPQQKKGVAARKRG